MTLQNLTSKELIKLYSELYSNSDIGELQKLGRKRQLDNLKKGVPGYKFSIDRAERVVDFLQKLPHVKGQLAGTLFKLEEWQKYDIVYPLFGWVTDDDQERRRFKLAYNEMARKTGKSFLMAGIGLYMAFFDGEAGAETYCLATKKDQAKILFDMANDMKNHTSLKRRVKTAYNTMTSKGNKFAPLGADSKTLDGLSTHCGIIDEYHSHKNSHLYDVIKSSTGARLNSLMIIITTAGFNKSSACYEEREYSEKILRGQLENENYFAFIASTDSGDDPFDPKVWKKANPNLGVSNSYEDFEVASKEARQKGGQTLVEFLTKRLNIWTNASSVWVKDDDFTQDDKLQFTEEELFGQDCYIGLDLSKTSDLSAYTLVFPQPGGTYKMITRAYVPERSYKEREQGDNIYKKFADDGTLTVTPGNVIDYTYIEEDIKKDLENFQVIELAYDRFMSAQIITTLSEHIDCIPFGQGFLSMSSPVKMIETLLLEKNLHHNNNALLRWQLSCILIAYDPAGNPKIDKSTSKAGTGGSGNRGSNSKVDCWVACAMGLGRASLSVYDESDDCGLYLL